MIPLTPAILPHGEETALPLLNYRQHFLAEHANIAHGGLVGHARLLAVEDQVVHAQPFMQEIQNTQDYSSRPSSRCKEVCN